MKYLITIALLVVLAVIAGGLYLVKGTYSDRQELIAFSYQFEEYLDVFEKQYEAVVSPGMGANVRRSNVHALLSQILTDELVDEERLALTLQASKQALLLRGDIDEAGRMAEPVAAHIKVLEREATLASDAKELRELLAIIKETQVTIESITTTLYTISDQTIAILDTIAANNGALTRDHIVKINQDTSDAETRYDQLSALYETLSALKEEQLLQFSTMVQDV